MIFKELSPEERPREKMKERGVGALSNAELLAVVLRSGTGGVSALELAQKLLSDAEGKLSALHGMSLERMCTHKGIGELKALSVVAALELGRRIGMEPTTPQNKPITKAEQVYRIMIPIMRSLDHEECWVLYLNRRNILSAKEMISSGDLESTIINDKFIIRKMIERKAESIILVHNHPSGDPTPSVADIHQTEKLRRSLSVVGFALLDHIIISSNRFFSFSEERTVIV
ncbi:MAG: DNA repair protein RadC [Bacteroidales bacterium]|nr:DNA repair protein RadC [Bacteroidales bacterium]MBQ2550010.1 DNA repair protein RadC [Bacteroidales bacterium]